MLFEVAVWGLVGVIVLGFLWRGRAVITQISEYGMTDADIEIEALARVIASEAGGEPREIQIAVAYAVVNEARRREVSIIDLVRGKSGTWGPQSTNGYVSSARTPNAKHRDLAIEVWSGNAPNQTQGATQFDSPRAQRALLEKRPDIYKKTPEQVAQSRLSDGKRLVLLPGIPEDRFRMWA